MKLNVLDEQCAFLSSTYAKMIKSSDVYRALGSNFLEDQLLKVIDTDQTLALQV